MHRGSPCGCGHRCLSVSYIETHGTATPLGDPIEVQAFRTAFDVSQNPDPARVCSGRQVEHRPSGGRGRRCRSDQNDSVPKEQGDPRDPALHESEPGTHLDETPFIVQTGYSAWEWDGVRRAGVSSFGVGGTNAHLVLEEAPPVPARAEPARPQVLLLSAKTTSALGDARTRPGRCARPPRRPGPVRPSPLPWRVAASTLAGGRGSRPRARRQRAEGPRTR